jgi:hypothetical protein
MDTTINWTATIVLSIALGIGVNLVTPYLQRRIDRYSISYRRKSLKKLEALLDEYELMKDNYIYYEDAKLRLTIAMLGVLFTAVFVAASPSPWSDIGTIWFWYTALQKLIPSAGLALTALYFLQQVRLILGFYQFMKAPNQLQEEIEERKVSMVPRTTNTPTS